MEKSCCDQDAWCLHMWLWCMMPPHVTGMHDAPACVWDAWCLHMWPGCMMPPCVTVMHNASTCDRDAWCLHVWQGCLMPPCVIGMHDASTWSRCMVLPRLHVIRMHDASTCDWDARCLHSGAQTEAGRQAQARQGGGKFPNRTENSVQETQTMRSCSWRRGEERSWQRKPQRNPLGCAICEVK